MKNNLLVTILFLVSCSLLISQDLKIKDLKVDSKNNGTIINFDLNKKIDLEDVTAWYSSEWFYITIYGANADSLSLVNYKIEPNINIDSIGAAYFYCDHHTTPGELINELKYFIQKKGVKCITNTEIESFEINTPKRKALQFFLRNSQLISKKSISDVNIIDDFLAKEIQPEEKEIIYEIEQKSNFNNVLIIIGGLIISAVDISNSSSFAAGALIAIVGSFL